MPKCSLKETQVVIILLVLTMRFSFNCDVVIDGYLTGSTALELFSRAGLDRTLLARIWNLADLDKDNMLNDNEFMIAMHLIMISMKGYELPLLTPIELVHNIETGIRVLQDKELDLELRLI